jgi:hypothetical protein
MESLVSQEIAAAMDRQLEHLDRHDVAAISSLARGGDIIFQEHALARKLSTYVVLPFEPAEFLNKSVRGAAAGDWEKRFWRIWDKIPQDQREVLALPANQNPYEACNRRELEIARKLSPEIALIALFDGTADGPGGTQDLIDRARNAGGRIEIIDSKKLLARFAHTR